MKRKYLYTIHKTMNFENAQIFIVCTVLVWGTHYAFPLWSPPYIPEINCIFIVHMHSSNLDR